jgi:hypothetical protein
MNLTREDCLDGLEFPFATGWALWRKALPVLLPHAAIPAALVAAFVSPIASHWADPDAQAAWWEVVLVLLIVEAIVIVTAAIISTAHTSDDPKTAPSLAARRFVPWATTLLMVGFLVLAGYLLFIIPGIYIAIRLFWADEFSLIHNQSPVASIRSSWRLTQGAVADVFGFQIKLGFVQLAAWLPAIIVITVVINLLDASGIGATSHTSIGLGVTAFAFTLAYAFSHACGVVFFYGLRADYELFIEEQMNEDQPAPQPLFEDHLPGAMSTEQRQPGEQISSDPNRPRCPSCGRHYDPADYRPDALTARCSYCNAELSLRSP